MQEKHARVRNIFPDFYSPVVSGMQQACKAAPRTALNPVWDKCGCMHHCCKQLFFAFFLALLIHRLCFLEACGKHFFPTTTTHWESRKKMYVLLTISNPQTGTNVTYSWSNPSAFSLKVFSFRLERWKKSNLQEKTLNVWWPSPVSAQYSERFLEDSTNLTLRLTCPEVELWHDIRIMS